MGRKEPRRHRAADSPTFWARKTDRRAPKFGPKKYRRGLDWHQALGAPNGWLALAFYDQLKNRLPKTRLHLSPDFPVTLHALTASLPFLRLQAFAIDQSAFVMLLRMNPVNESQALEAQIAGQSWLCLGLWGSEFMGVDPLNRRSTRTFERFVRESTRGFERFVWGQWSERRVEVPKGSSIRFPSG